MSVSPPTPVPFVVGQPETAAITYLDAAGNVLAANPPTTFFAGISLANSDTTGASTLTLSADFAKITATLLQPNITITGTLNFTPPGSTAPIALLSFTISDQAPTVVAPTTTQLIPASASLSPFAPEILPAA